VDLFGDVIGGGNEICFQWDTICSDWLSDALGRVGDRMGGGSAGARIPTVTSGGGSGGRVAASAGMAGAGMAGTASGGGSDASPMGISSGGGGAFGRAGTTGGRGCLRQGTLSKSSIAALFRRDHLKKQLE